MDNFEIREAMPNEIDSVFHCVYALYEELKNHKFPFEINPLRLQDILTAYIKSKTSMVLVLEYEGKISGVLVGHISKLDGRYAPTYGGTIGRITELYIAQNARRKKLASQLILKAFEWFTQQSVTYVDADILAENFASQNFFEQMGFSQLAQKVYKTI